MKYYLPMAQKQIFHLHNVVEMVGNRHTAKRILTEYIEKGFLQRVKPNLFVAIGSETNDVIANKYQIASHINDSSFVSHHSAFEYYGFYNQIYHSVNVSSLKSFQPFSFAQNEYICNATKFVDYVMTDANGIRVTTIERTIVDSIKDVRKVSDYEELNTCLSMVSYVDESKLIAILKQYDQAILWKKVGYMLENHKDIFYISPELLYLCRMNGKNSIGYFDSRQKANQVYNAKWQLYVFETIHGGDA